jgi:hypothetical protein
MGEVPPETSRTVFRKNKLCNIVACWIYGGIFLRCTDGPMNVKCKKTISFYHLLLVLQKYGEVWILYKVTKNKLKASTFRGISATFLLKIVYLLFAFHKRTMKIERNVIVPYSLYGCKTWSVLLRKVCIQTTFENMVVRNILGLGWRK